MAKKEKILVTGGAGFIGSEFVRQGIAQGYDLAVVDKITYAGDLTRLKEVAEVYRFYKADICSPSQLENIIRREKPRVLVHFAAETHVDRSLQNGIPFITTNVTGMQNLINLSMRYGITKFIHISTDEVYGESRSGRFKETALLNPGNPYAATKVAAELLLKAAVKTYQLPAIIVRPANNYGPWQYPEKFVPVIIFKALKNEKVPVYGKGAQIREWLHVTDCVNGIYHILHKGEIGGTYNIGSYFEQNNLATARAILRLLGKPESLIGFVQDRPGHDFRYSVDCSNLRKLGWRPKMRFQQGMKDTVDWYIDHLEWMEKKLKFLQNYWKKVYKP